MSTRPRRLFTPLEDELIIAAYSHVLLKDIAAQLGRDWKVVQQHVNGLIREGRLSRRLRAYAPPWTEAEDEYLADTWGKLADLAVATKLGRTVNACKIRATRRFGLARKDQFYTVRAVARLMGVDDHLVRRWIDEGWLLAVKSVVRCGDGNLAWRIEDAWLERYLREWPWRYNRRRIEAGTYWRNLADQIAAADPWIDKVEAARILGVAVISVDRYVRTGELECERTLGAGGWGEYRFARAHVEHARPRLPLPRHVPRGLGTVRLTDPHCRACGRRFTHPNHYRRVNDGTVGVCRFSCSPVRLVPVAAPIVAGDISLVGILRPGAAA